MIQHNDEAVDHLQICIRKFVKIFKVFDHFPPTSNITIKTPDIDALVDVKDRGIHIVFQTECSQISFDILQPICHEYYIVSEGEWSIHLEALKDVLSIFDPNLLTAPSASYRQGGQIDHFFPRPTPSHELCHIHLDVENSILALGMQNTEDGLISKCKLALHTPIPLKDFELAFSIHDKAAGFSIKSSLLINAFSTIDDTCQFIQIAIDRSIPKVMLKCDGLAGESIISFSGVALANFTIDIEQWPIDKGQYPLNHFEEISFTYFFSKFKDLLKTFLHTSVSNFQINPDGVLHIRSNMIVDFALKQEVYIESFIVPLADDEDDE